MYVDELLDNLQACGLRAYVNSCCVASPMYADDLALIADSAVRLQALLDIVSRYATKWRYQVNALKSGIMVFGESPRSRASN